MVFVYLLLILAVILSIGNKKKGAFALSFGSLVLALILFFIHATTVLELSL